MAMREDGSESTDLIINNSHNNHDRSVPKLGPPPHVIGAEPLGASDNHSIEPQIFSNAPQNPSRSVNSTPLHSELSETSIQPNSSSKTHLSKSNPVAQAFRKSELGKAFLAFIMPTATILLAVLKKDSSPNLFNLILCLLCVALVALLYGISLSKILPKIANALVQFGAACIYTSFFMVVGFHLPPALVWIPLICFFACIGLSVFSCLTIEKDCVNPNTPLPI